jgi:hypothetical protein
VGSTIGHDWRTAFGEPGKFTISVRPRTPDTPRLRMPSGVCRRDSARIVSVDHVERGLGRDVVVRHPGAAGGEDEAHLLVVGEPPERSRDRLAVVGHGVVDRLEARRLAQLHQRGARLVVLAPRP